MPTTKVGTSDNLVFSEATTLTLVYAEETEKGLDAPVFKSAKVRVKAKQVAEEAVTAWCAARKVTPIPILLLMTDLPPQVVAMCVDAAKMSWNTCIHCLTAVGEARLEAFQEAIDDMVDPEGKGGGPMH